MSRAMAAFKTWGVCSTIFISAMMSGCENPVSTASTEDKAALLMENTIDEQGWNRKGYEGLLSIQAELGMDVSYKENVTDLEELEKEMRELDKEGVDLVFGHGKVFADMFLEINEDYPDIHFVSFNGQMEGDNVTAVQFQGYAMGYFAGRLSSMMTETNTIGVIAAQEWQPETEGFVEGANNQEKTVEVLKESVGSWNNKEKALQVLNSMTSKQADIIYPAGNGFHVDVINKAKDKGLRAIGYVGDQSDLGENTVLTSTIQHVEKVYRTVAEKYQAGKLETGTVSYGFKEGAVSLGTFSPEVPEDLKQQLHEEIEHYKKTGKLPGR